MKKFIRYDYNYYWSILTLFLFIFFVFISCFLKYKYEIENYFVLGILPLISLIGLVLINISGIHFNYNKRKIFVFDYFLLRKIKMDDIKSIKLIEIKKSKKKRLFPLLSEGVINSPITFEAKYVYRNGKIFRILINKKDGNVIELRYSWLFCSRSKKIVEIQQQRIISIIAEFNKYKF